MKDQLVEFLRSKKDQMTSPGTDWQAKKKAWIESVHGLYAQVEEMLKDSKESGDVKLQRRKMQITEDFVGTYSIPRLELNVGGERVEFRPMGVTVLGAAGRVDVRGERDVVTLLRQEVGAESKWIMILQRVPKLRTAQVDKETLKNVLEQVMLPLH
jgi:hypothetical protein